MVNKVNSANSPPRPCCGRGLCARAQRKKTLRVNWCSISSLELSVVTIEARGRQRRRASEREALRRVTCNRLRVSVLNDSCCTRTTLSQARAVDQNCLRWRLHNSTPPCRSASVPRQIERTTSASSCVAARRCGSFERERSTVTCDAQKVVTLCVEVSSWMSSIALWLLAISSRRPTLRACELACGWDVAS